MLKHHCFVINLERSPLRYQRIKSQLEAQKIDFSRLAAVDGAQLSSERIDNLYQYTDPNAYYKQLNKGEVGCYLSHVNAWHAIVEKNLDFAIVLEDDVNLIGDLSGVIAVVEALPDDWDYLKLAEHSRKRRVVSRQQFSALERVIYNKVPARTCAQIISLAGAKKLIAHSQKILRPIDIDLQYWWEKDLRIFGLMPYPAEPNQQFGSDIDELEKRNVAKRQRWKKIKHMLRFYFLNKQLTQRRLAQVKAALERTE